jgi:hypothetical protein
VGQELVDLLLEHRRLLLEFGRAGQNLAGGRTGRERRFAQLADVGRDVLGVARREVDRAGKILAGDRLLVDRCGDRDAGRLELLNLVGDRSKRFDAGAGGFLDRADLRGDFLGRLAGLRRKLLDLGGDDGETAARLAAPRRLDRGIESEQVGALGEGNAPMIATTLELSPT